MGANAHQPDHAFGYPREDEWPTHSDEVVLQTLYGEELRHACVLGVSEIPDHVIIDIPDVGHRDVRVTRLAGLSGGIPFVGQRVNLPHGYTDLFVLGTTEKFEVAEAGFRGIHEAPESE